MSDVKQYHWDDSNLEQFKCFYDGSNFEIDRHTYKYIDLCLQMCKNTVKLI